MKAIVDPEGRIALPHDVREATGLAPGTEPDVRVRDGVIEIEPAYLPVRFERDGHLLVAVPLIPVPPMTTEMVEQVLDEMRREREGID